MASWHRSNTLISITLLLSIAMIFVVHSTDNDAVQRSDCFNLDKELLRCKRRLGIQMPRSQLSGYSLGFGSINDTEYMCKTRWHISLINCMRKRSEENCQGNEQDRYKQRIWSISLDSRKFVRAANYICHEHNLRILREHKDKCLKTQEKLAEQCNVNRNHTIREVVTALQNKSSQLLSSSLEYSAIVRRTLAYYECKSLQEKLECLLPILQQACPPNALRLIMNFFKETLPDDCHFDYESRIQTGGASHQTSSSAPSPTTSRIQLLQRDRGAIIERFNDQPTIAASSMALGSQRDLATTTNTNHALLIVPNLTSRFIVLLTGLTTMLAIQFINL